VYMTVCQCVPHEAPEAVRRAGPSAIADIDCVCKCNTNILDRISMHSIGCGVLLLIAMFRGLNHACIFGVVQVTKSLQDPLEVENNLPGISDNVRE